MGRQIRFLRTAHDITADDLAAAARRTGLGWRRSTVSMIESGKRQLQARELLALPHVFSEAGAPLELRQILDLELVADVTHVNGPYLWISDHFCLTAPNIDMLLANRWGEIDWDWVDNPESLRVDSEREATLRAARDLSLSVEELQDVAIELWGRPYYQERERRATAHMFARRRRVDGLTHGDVASPESRADDRRWAARQLLDEVRAHQEQQQGRSHE